MNMLGLSSSVHFTYSMLLKISSFWTIHKSSVSTGITEQIMPILRILCSNGNLFAWTVVSLTTAKFKPLILLHSESYITTDGQLASLSWNKAPIWGLRPYFYYCQTVAGLLMWGALSHERTGLSFTNASGPRQCSHFRVRVPWDSWPYFTLSALRPPSLHPPQFHTYYTLSKSKLLYDWRFTANYFVLVSSPLRPTTRLLR
jgi:hypothetical protein